MDADIQAAADALALDRIRTQEYRNDIAWRKASDQQRAQTYGTQVQEIAQLVDVQQQTAAGLLPPQQEVRLAIVRAIAANYMKPTTTSAQAPYIEADANLDARRLEAAVKELEQIVAGIPLLVKTAP